MVFYMRVQDADNSMIKLILLTASKLLPPAPPKALVRAVLAAMAFWTALAATDALAVVVPDLYQAAVNAPDRSEAGLAAAFEAALRVVVVKVTGRRSAPQEAAFAPLLGNARRYMQQYRAGSGNQIWVAFDGPALERWLAQGGLPLWGRDRPATLMWIGVGDKNGGSVLTREDSTELKRSLDQQAAARGIPLIWPTAADVTRYGVSFATLSQAPASSLADSAKRAGAAGMLIGRAADARAASVRWVFLFQGRSAEYSGAAEGIDRVADAYAGIYAASGESAPIDIEVAGVGSLQSYASVQTYLESLTQLSKVSVVGFDNDILHLRVVARGGLEPLQRVLAQDGRLQATAPGPGGVPRFRASP